MIDIVGLSMHRVVEPVCTVAEMRAAERAAMDTGISEWELMRRAGEGAAQWVARMAAGRAVTVLCGPGNNGGDGYVIAEYLRQLGNATTVIAPAEPKAATAKQARARYGGAVLQSASGAGGAVLVDCLFGYGLTRGVSDEFAKALEECSATHSYKIAIDVPSGVESDTGAMLSWVPQYDLTLALGGWKQAHFLMPSAPVMGELRLVPIGLNLQDCPAAFAREPEIAVPATDSHKYRRGLLAVVAGAMPGASLLAVRAAMSSGAGYVKLLSGGADISTPAEVVNAAGPLIDELKDPRIGAVLIGPGLGRDDAAQAKLAAVLEAGFTTVVDADALHLLDDDMMEGVDASRLILTPHDGELAQLCHGFGVVAEDRLTRARRLHDVTGLTVLAKGPDTILVGEGGAIRFFPRGSSWLSVAGSGDVLAGIIASRCAGETMPFHVAQDAVWLHHEAARIAGPAFTAGQLAVAVQAAMAQFL